MIKKVSLILLLGLFTTGCSVTTAMKNPKYEWLTGGDVAYGDKAGDVCYTCGENFIFIQNPEFNSQKKTEQGIKY
tara:strand:- start:3215 stop:3439 length:225 start_codon:yes stop_codon:yes gene_type:complete